MGLSGGVKTINKNSKKPKYTTYVSPLLAPEALWQARVQAIPLGLTVVRCSTSQGPQPGLMVQSRSWYKAL